ncbi:MAG: ATP-binding protein [Fimbriimonadaceae bacterium]
MQNDSTKAPIIDRPLDPKSVARVKAPGVGVILRFGSDVEVILREAADVAKVRGRLIYVFIVVTEAIQNSPMFKEWERKVFQSSHAIKVDRFKITESHLVEELVEFCINFDIRLLLIEEQRGNRGFFPWKKSIQDKLNFEPQLPPLFIIRNEAGYSKVIDQHKMREWSLLGVSLVALIIGGYTLRDVLPDRIEVVFYILVLALVSSKVSRTVSLIGSFLAVTIFNFIHVEPVDSLRVENPMFFLVLAGMIIVSLIINTLSWQLRDALSDAKLQERRKSAFFNLTRDLLQVTDVEGVLTLIESHIKDYVGSDIAVYIKRGEQVDVLRTGLIDISSSESDQKACDLALTTGIEAGIGTHAHPLAFGLYLPITSLEGISGCLAVYPKRGTGHFPAEQLRMIDTFTGLLGIALERIWYEEVRLKSERQYRDASLQNTLLRSVSHDLKTPLTSITGFANQLYEDPNMPLEMRQSTYQTIRDEAWRLTNLINNLLSLTKLESGALLLNIEPMFVEEIFGTAVNNVRQRFTDHQLKIDLPADISDVQADPMLINQALINLLENAVKYTPPGTTVTLRARSIPSGVQLSVLDDGPGIPDGESEKIFEKFVRSVEGRQVEGTGLGLAIVRAIADLHGGKVTARNRTNKGARFDIRLPAVETIEDKIKKN